MLNCCAKIQYNSYDSIKDMCNRVIEYLVMNNEDIWKLLKYNTPDALYKENLTQNEKSKLIYSGKGDMSEYNVFRTAYLDDAFDKMCSQLKVYVTSINPDNHLLGTVDIGIEVIVHTKLIYLEDYQNRLEVLLQNVISTLNGVEVNGVGKLSFDRNLSFYDLVKLNLYNNRNFYGYTIIMSVKTSDIDNTGNNICESN